jgi:hypothetical protein
LVITLGYHSRDIVEGEKPILKRGEGDRKKLVFKSKVKNLECM